jgi:hypothetical protein
MPRFKSIDRRATLLPIDLSVHLLPSLLKNGPTNPANHSRRIAPLAISGPLSTATSIRRESISHTDRTTLVFRAS